MAKSETRSDDYANALEAGLGAADAIQRTLARARLDLEQKRVAVRSAEAVRVGAKYPKNKDVASAAAAQVDDHTARVAAARLAANRSYVQGVTVDAGASVVHGLVVIDKPADIDVLALDGEAVVARARTDAHGYFKLTVPVSSALQPHENARTSGSIRLVAKRGGGAEITRDTNAYAVRPGRVTYRELYPQDQQQ